MHEKPTGSITIFSDDGRQITELANYRHPTSGELTTSNSIPVNLDGGNVLPGSSRVFVADWNKNIREGKFVAKLSLEYDKSRPALTAETNFEIRDELNLKKFQLNQLENSTDFTIVVENHGNVSEKLEGKIEIKNEFNNVVASPEIPVEDYIKPGSTVTITVPWLDKKAPAGEYTATLQANYGFLDKELSSEIQFSVVKTGLTNLQIGGIAGLAVLLIIVIAFLFRRRSE